MHDCCSLMALRPSHERVHAQASHVTGCITLALLLCSLVHNTMASAQLPASSSNVHLIPNLRDNSKVFTQHTFLRNTVLPLSHAALSGQRASVAREGRQDPAGSELRRSEEQIISAAVITPAAEDLPSRSAERDMLHFSARAARSISAIRRVEMHGPPVTNRKILFVEVVVLADHTLYKHYRTRAHVQKRVTQVLSVANRVLGEVGVMLLPMDVQVWDRQDEMRVTSRLNTNVDGLQQHRLNLLQRHPKNPNDYTVLLTRKRQFAERESCGSPLRGMCRKQQSVSVVQDEGKGPSMTGLTLAHQVGHSLGMEDDADDPDHTCRCYASTCVMSRHFRNASIPNLVAWSACSRQSFDSALETLALDCLRNKPRINLASICGNGVVDDGEQCDCGPAEFCDNPCCVAATCRLALNASCASGSCCDIQNCKPKPPGVLCRSAITECDLPEFCSGYSEYCSKDVTKADGEPCREGHCFRGECGSLEGQCKRLWGPSATAASTECYSKLNVLGDHTGNCGLERSGFRRCRKKESLCGTLHCIASAPSSRLLQEHRNGSRRAGPHKCHFISGSENYPAHHWLTPDGVPCGSGKMCINQQCKNVPKLSGICRDGCSGNGVCNSLGHCHCNAGFSPPNCSLPGLGGSVDSNVMYDTSDSRALITLAWVVMVLLFSLLAVTCCSWGCFKGWYKRKGRDTISDTLPCCATCLDVCCCPIMNKIARWMLTVGSSQEQKKNIRNIEVQEGVNEHMLCSVDVDMKDISKTSSWGVANEKLVTDVVTIKPKDSPDFRRKVKLPPDSPLLHHKSVDNLQRPKYQQSISMDSGCVSDSDDDAPNKRGSLQLSMSSLLSIFMRYGDKKTKMMTDETHHVKSFGSQKSIPLSRFVVDPLAGRCGSRQATPSPKHARPSYNRSFSTDVASTRRNKKGRTPPPPPPSTLKPNKSEENISKSSEMPSCDRLLHRQHSPLADAPIPVFVTHGKPIPKDGVKDAETTGSTKVPLKAPKNKPLPSPPKFPPIKHNSPQREKQRYQGKPILANGSAKRMSPKTSLGTQGSR